MPSYKQGNTQPTLSISSNQFTASYQKHRVQAALRTDAETARGTRRWNDANVLALSLRLNSPEVVKEILDAFLHTPLDPNELTEIAKLP